MTLSVPPAVNYQSPLTALPTRWDQAPPEGSKLIPCEVDWGTMGGSANCVSFNLQNNATLNFSQIVALSVDNSACGADIEFIFPDTTETLSIPAYSPKTIVPVFTNQTQFWLWSPNAQSEDITRFSILNSMPPPIAVPTTQEQNTAVNNNITVATGSVVIIPAGVNGTVEAVNIAYNLALGATTGKYAALLEDGTGAVVAGGQLLQTAGSGSNINGILLSLSDLRVRFQNGLNLVSSVTNSNGSVSVNVYYRTP